MNRTTILNDALKATKDRGEDYGKPSENFERIATLWEAYTGKKYTVADVGLMMMLVKISRLMESPTHEDSWVDLAGYSAVTAEAIAYTSDIPLPPPAQQSTAPMRQVSRY